MIYHTDNNDMITALYHIEGERPFKCTDCGQAYMWHSSLKLHSRIHTGLFSCLLTYLGTYLY